jgi:hypothetical protein
MGLHGLLQEQLRLFLREKVNEKCEVTDSNAWIINAFNSTLSSNYHVTHKSFSPSILDKDKGKDNVAPAIRSNYYLHAGMQKYTLIFRTHFSISLG